MITSSCRFPRDSSFRAVAAWLFFGVLLLASFTGLCHAADSIPAAVTPAPWYSRLTSADYSTALLQSGGPLIIVGAYFLSGVVLSLLPCSYPMIPIVSAIIIGEGTTVTRRRGLVLSLSYVLGMSLVYTVLGVMAAFIGQSMGTWLQNPYVLGAFAILLTAFSATLIAGVDIALPARWQNASSGLSRTNASGKIFTAATMGALSSLVVGACMTAPLFAVLSFIAHTGNAWLGGAALFAMGLGLGMPLIAIGVGAGTLLPRAGSWMNNVKVFFGLFLLAAALRIIWPVLGNRWHGLGVAAWIAVALCIATWKLSRPRSAASDPFRRFAMLAIAPITAALIWIGSSPVLSQSILSSGSAATSTVSVDGPLEFEPVRTLEDLDAKIKAAGHPVMLDFYADWCTSCVEMEKTTFENQNVKARLQGVTLLKADVSANNADDQVLLKKFGLFGPPGMVFFNAQGREVARSVGYEPANRFIGRLDQILAR
ncbi:protein-disulfide reductase DsbD [Burkholderia gladioli]|uniref:protein-disulfide reductase DsbD n=1 Tax=Burkholderia gladioli TaxID=28095 RepID=UPI001FC8DA18|nr:protein-disulfide reductase DsbD [Burkholderia gladioli]